MRIYNTLSKQKEDFLSEGATVRMFVCGPTVYDRIHIGNARTFTIFDTIAKYLRARGYKLQYIQNITDIDDKIIKRAQEESTTALELAQKFEKLFKEDTAKLGIDSPEYKKATEHIAEVIEQVQQLIDKGNAYLIDGDGYYFDLSTFADYGKLSGRTATMANDAVSRIDENDKKRNRGDFCLWKFSKEGEPAWPSPWGSGRPGWHIEDTAITQKYFGPQYEIHGGAMDLIFPHHEAEIAQQEAASGKKPFVRYWLHPGFLEAKQEKMSKSLGNFLTLSEALERYTPEALRFYFLSAHYRSPLDYALENMDQAEAAITRLGEFRAKLVEATKEALGSDDPEMSRVIETIRGHYVADMDDDFNTAKAFSRLFDLLRYANPKLENALLSKTDAQNLLDLLNEMNTVLGVVPQNLPEIPEAVTQLAIDREEARAAKNYDAADYLRRQIEALGYRIDDTKYGPFIRKHR